MVDTAGTLVKAAETVKAHGAAEVLAICTHGILSGNAYGSTSPTPNPNPASSKSQLYSLQDSRIQNLNACEALSKVVVTKYAPIPHPPSITTSISFI